MINTGLGLIKPKETLPKEFFDNKKYGDFFYQRLINDINLQDDFDIILHDKDYKEVFSRKTIEEDIEKSINFLNNNKYLELIYTKPTNKEVLNILFKDNRMDRGIIQSNFTTRKTQVGRIETSNIDIVFSKEIVDKMISYASKISPYDYWLSKNFKGYSEKYYNYSEKETITHYIDWAIDVMNHANYIHPNTLLLPKDVYKLFFDEDIENITFLTKSKFKLFEMDVWINPHNTDIILYKNGYDDIFESSLLFSPFYLFGKQIEDNIILPKDIKGNDKYEDYNSTYSNDKYIHSYSLVELGFNTKKNFMVLYK